MYASIFAKSEVLARTLDDIARQFSPMIEEIDTRLVVFDVAGNSHLIGAPREIADAIHKTTAKQGVTANISIAQNPDAALCVAQFIEGITVIPPGREAEYLAHLPIPILRSSQRKTKNASAWHEMEQIIDTLQRWGIGSFGEFAALSEDGITTRLGIEGARLHRFARGAIKRPLLVSRQTAPFEQSLELEYSIESLEPLSFILRRLIGALCDEAQTGALAIQTLRIRLNLEDHSEFERELALPFPTVDSKTLFSLLTLTLNRITLDSAIIALTLAAAPVKPRTIQGGLFERAAPQPEKLQLLLSRIEDLVGAENVGYPALLNTHRPDGFVIKRFDVLRKQSRERTLFMEDETLSKPLLGFRVFRPLIEATVREKQGIPVSIKSRPAAAGQSIKGKIAKVAGPWRTTGDWWQVGLWQRDEWDISLAEGGLYRIHHNLENDSWFIEGMYD